VRYGSGMAKHRPKSTTSRLSNTVTRPGEPLFKTTLSTGFQACNQRSHGGGTAAGRTGEEKTLIGREQLLGECLAPSLPALCVQPCRWGIQLRDRMAGSRQSVPFQAGIVSSARRTIFPTDVCFSAAGPRGNGLVRHRVWGLGWNGSNALFVLAKMQSGTVAEFGKTCAD